MPHVAVANAPAADDVIEVDDLAKPAASTLSLATAAAALDANAGEGTATETSFRFEGDRSPRLVFVDGIVMGTTTKPVRAKCGTHSVKIGGKGAERSLDLPCGGEQGIVVEPNGKWRAE